MVLPRVAYSILLACAFGACSPDDEASCVCKPIMKLEMEHLSEHQAVCNNATFHWMINTLLTEISTQKDSLGASQTEIDRINKEVEAYQSAYHEYKGLHERHMRENEMVMEEYDKLRERTEELLEENMKLREEIEKLKDVQKNAILPKDCGDIQQQGSRYSGLYTVYPKNLPMQGLEVFCDLDTAGGGWLVIQRRQDGSQKFDRDWNEYKEGFGQMAREFWLGNEYVHQITQGRVYELRIDMLDFEGNHAYATYDHFSLEDESLFYTLRLGYYNGNAGDAMAHHKDHKFSTKDVDNDLSRSGNCSKLYGGGGWWFVRCYDSNLNGVYKETGEDKDAIVWFHLQQSHKPLRHVSMKIRPLDFKSHV